MPAASTPSVKPPMPGGPAQAGSDKVASQGAISAATSAATSSKHSRGTAGSPGLRRSSSQLERSKTVRSIMPSVRGRIRAARERIANGFDPEAPLTPAECEPAETGLPSKGGGSLSSSQATLARVKASLSRIRPSCTIPFGSAVFCPIIAVALVSFGTLIPLMFTSVALLDDMSETYEADTRRQIDRISELYENTSYQIFGRTLDDIEMRVTRGVLEPPDRAVSTMWGAVRTQYISGLWRPEDEAMRRQLARRCWEELNNQWSCTDFKNNVCSGMAASVYLAVNGQQVMGAAISEAEAKPQKQGWLFDSARWEHLNIWEADPAKGQRKGDQRVEPYTPSNMPFYEVQQNISLSEGQKAKARKMWSKIFVLDGQTAPWLKGHAPELALSWTVPVILPPGDCGDYTCFKGVIAADTALNQVRERLDEAWADLRTHLANLDIFIDTATSSIFIVNEVSRHFPEQEGLLIGTSAANDQQEALNRLEGVTLLQAVNSTWDVVAGAARAVRAYQDQGGKHQNLQFSMDEALQNEYRPCVDTSSDNCYRATLRRISLDENLQWLVVAALPAKPFTTVYRPEVTKIEQDVEDNKQRIQSLSSKGISSAAISFVIVVIFCLLMIPLTSCLVLQPVRQLTSLMQKLSGYQADLQTFSEKQLVQQCRARKLSMKGSKEELVQRIRDYDAAQDREHDSREFFDKLEEGHGGFVREVKELQDGFSHLSHSIKVLERFVPSAVVQNLRSKTQREDREQASRINPKRRVVTIMFSDIKDFTSISEKLIREDRFEDLMFLLTWYLTEMIEVVEGEDGTVGEVLGDGLLAFWNTPNLDEEHAKKACMAAIKQQQKLEELNTVLEQKNLPRLAIRVGLHTGEVFQGNLGVEFKRNDGTIWRRMKFGCMGDPVNLASRLEGLCKVYGVGVICSEATVQALPPSHGCVFRKLSVAQVKGKQEPTTLYELIYEYDSGIPQEYCIAGQCNYVSEKKKEQVRLYERAFTAWQEARFTDASKLLETLLKMTPNDFAAERLSKKCKELAEIKSSWRMLEAKKDLENWTGVEKMFDK